MATLDDIAWEEIAEAPEWAGRSSDPRGAFQVRGLRATPVRAWTLRASMMPASEATALRAVFEATRGAGLTTLTPPGESAMAVEFVPDEDGVARLRIDRTDAAEYVVELLVREVL